MKHEPSRRAVVACLTLGLVPFRALAQIAQLCPNDPILTSGKTPLTIDTHAHFFNGRDLQIKEFLSKTTVRKGSELYPLVNAMGSIMQALGWHAAPDATSELDAIASYAKLIKGCDGEGQIREATRPSFREGYLKGRRELQDASKRIAIAAGAAVLGPDTGATPLKAAIEDLPETFDEFEVRRSSGATVLGSNPTFLGYLQFVLHHFNYRHINAIDYLTTYSKDSARKIDLVVPSMVDYDWWLAGGRATPTTLSEQVAVMARISVLLGGRVHGFVPFCPYREAKTGVSDADGDSLRLVKSGIENHGFIGVKLYPPMGFAPWGNTGQDVWRKVGHPAGAEADFGKRLDAAMKKLFDYCLKQGVPIMAHTNHSNGAYKEFEDLAGSQYWSLALKQFPGLKVSFGHFGDTDLELHDDDQASETRKFLKLMTQAAGSNGANAFADSGFFAGALIDPTSMTATLRSLYAASENSVLRERLMYGTDWSMILPQRHVERYLSDFIDVISKVEKTQPGTVRGTSLADAFFGQNASEYLGLKLGQPNRKRLENFYAVNKVAKPDWMRKVDA